MYLVIKRSIVMTLVNIEISMIRTNYDVNHLNIFRVGKNFI